MNEFLDFLLCDFRLYRRLTKCHWYNVEESDIDAWGSTSTYWTRVKPEGSDKRILKGE